MQYKIHLVLTKSFLDVSKLMDGRCKQISDVYIINSSKITFSKDKIGAGNFADVYKGVILFSCPLAYV